MLPISDRSKAMIFMLCGSTLISSTGLIIRNMEIAGALEINLFRGISLALTILLILSFKQKRQTLHEYMFRCSVSFVYTSVLNQNDIVQSINSTLKIKLPNKLLSIKDTDVNFIQEVARFTQISKQIPIELKNVPKGKELRIKPAEVELSYWVAMQDVDKINISDFKIPD